MNPKEILGLLEEAAHPPEDLISDETALNSHRTTIHPSMDKNNNDNSMGTMPSNSFNGVFSKQYGKGLNMKSNKEI